MMDIEPRAFSLRKLAPPTTPLMVTAESAAAWMQTGNVTAPRSNGHTATRVSGKVLLAGGLGTNDTSISSADLYHPTTGTWSATGGMIIRRSWHSATLLPNGGVLVAGGADQQPGAVSVHNSAEVYMPSLGTWAFTDDMSGPRSFH